MSPGPDDVDSRLLTPEYSGTSREKYAQPISEDWRTSRRKLLWAFALSLSLNVLLLGVNIWTRGTAIHELDLSLYAKLPRDSFMSIDPFSKYGVGNPNETDRSLLWESLEVGDGEIALDKQWARAKGLPEAQSFPWDQSKGIYLLSGHHNLHCLRKIRRWVTIAHHNGTQLDSYVHIVHCMSALLQDTLCEADDTPIYTTARKVVDSGDGQRKRCRNWHALNDWAREHTACFGFVNETQGVDDKLQRLKWCPKGSPYAKTMREEMGLPPNWYEDRPSEISSLPPYWEDFGDTEPTWDVKGLYTDTAHGED